MEAPGGLGPRARKLVALVSLGVALGAMAVDHLFGTSEDADFPVDPTMFALTSVLSVGMAVFLFGWLIPREQRSTAAHEARTALVCSLVSIVPGLALVWIGVPFVVAGAGVALGLDARAREPRWSATAAIVLGALLLGLGAIDYALAAIG